MFTWIPIHKETVSRILDLQDPQTDLLAILREMNEQELTVIRLQDRSDTDTFPLNQIDPLTFLSSFNRGITDENRRDNWRFLKNKWNLSAAVPDDFAGIPLVNNMSSWFFPSARRRAQNHVDLLWQLVRQAAGHPIEKVDEQLFEQCRQLRKVSINNLTIGLFWINPTQYLPCDRKTRAYGEHNGVRTLPTSYGTYGDWLRQMSTALGDDYAKVSHNAHLWATARGEDDDSVDADEVPVKSRRRFWVVAPGRKAKLWDEFHEQGIIGIDWEELSDLNQFTDKEEIRRKLQEHDGSHSSKVNETRACWDLARVMRPGDVVFAKLGVSKIVGFGIVSGDYRFDHSRPSFKHTRPVDWRGKGAWELPPDTRFHIKTLTEITRNPDLVARVSKLVGFDLTEDQKGSLNVPTTAASKRSYWWLNANPQMWSFEELGIGARQTYTSHNENGNKRQKYRYFQEVRPGDILVGYVTSPQREIVGICRITKGLHSLGQQEQIEFEKIERLEKPVLYETLKDNPELERCEPLVNHQGSLFKLTEDEYEIIRGLIDEANSAETPAPAPYTKQMAMDGVFLTETHFDEAMDALREKKNIILQGPPGVGKTFVARRLATALIGSNDPQRVEMIQFHQSYSYEDFIQGFRPTSKGFDVRYGVFHQFCRRAQRDEVSGHPYVFIIDEINRGNLSKIFGELMMLIECDKRGTQFAIPLAYASDSSDKFYIPENLYFIGTMNTADRSLAMVDYALRRRFRFLTLRPEFENGAFEKHLNKNGVGAELVKRIITRMKVLNQTIAGDTKNLGPGYEIGHSYFCPRTGIQADERWYRRVVESEIVPLIQEYWFDDEKKVDQLRAALLT